MILNDIKIIGPKVENIRYLNGLPVIGFQLSSQPTRDWVNIFDKICKTNFNSKRPIINVVGDSFEFCCVGDEDELQTILNILSNDVEQTNIEFKKISEQLQQQRDSTKIQQVSTLQKIRDSLGKLKY